jgi:hypothetical protein
MKKPQYTRPKPSIIPRLAKPPRTAEPVLTKRQPKK